MAENLWNFIRENWSSPVEILVLAFVLYHTYLYLRGTQGARVLIGLGLLVLGLTLLSQLLQLQVIGWILERLSVFIAIALVVIFQPELRRVLTDLGSHRFFRSSYQEREMIELIVDAVFELASKGFGALIAIEREINLRTLADTGVDIDSSFTKELVLTIFQPKTVLHDGGVIIRNDRVKAAACIFPLTQREDLDRNLGLRHRAGLGLAEQSDAIVIIVSEETGQVSICQNGVIERNLNVEKFRRRLNELLVLEANEKPDSP
ncbi:MAG TPA: diadenylate cyclase CdaA [Chthoniobacterales bacterium]